MLGIIGLIGIFSFISTIIYCYVKKRKIDTITYVFWVTILGFVLALIKGFIGDNHLTLLQSFWDANYITYIHYSIMLSPVAIIVPIIYNLIFKVYADEFIKWFTSIGIILLFVVGVFTDGVPIWLFLFLVVIIATISFVLAVLLKKELIIDEKGSFFSTCSKYSCITLLFVFYIFIYLPNELYFTNSSEFPCSYLPFLLILVLATIVGSIFIIFITSLLPKEWRAIMMTLIFSISICEYIQAMFLNGKLKSLTGEVQTWNSGTIAINLLIWAIIISMILFISVKVREAIHWMNYASVFLMIMLCITVVTLAFQSKSEITGSRKALTSDGALEISSEQNVIVFVLDCFDTSVMEQVIENEPGFVEPLNDFVFYNNVVSRFPRTIMAIPFLLTGSEWNENSSEAYKSYAYNDECFISRLNLNDIQLGIYTDVGYIDDKYYYLLDNYAEDVSQKNDILNTCRVMYRTSLYKTMPFVFKNNYFYYSSDITDIVVAGDVWNINNDIPFYNMINKNGLNVVDSDKRKFMFYHMRGDHWPYYLSEDVQVDVTYREVSSTSQAKGCLNIVYNYINNLKKLGKYDDTTIIITSDHGNVVGYNGEDGGVTNVCMPILMVKLSNQVQNGLTIDSKPVSQVDLLATILSEYGLSYDEYEYKLSDEIDEDRERFFYNEENYRMKVGVIGDAHDISNWKVLYYSGE